MSEFTTLGELARQGRVILNDGYRTRSDELGEPGVPILRVAEVQDGHVAPSFGDHVRSEFRSKFGMKTSATDDVVVTTKGTVGRVALMRSHHPEFVYSPQVCFFRCAPDGGVLPEWLYYWFKGPEFASQALGVQSQTDMAPYINLADMRAINISVPSTAKQRAIAGVLGALDDKIESNRRIASKSRQLIKLEWEVAKDVSWCPQPVSSLAAFVNGGAYTKDATGRGRMVIRIAELNGGPGGSTVYNELDVPEDRLARPGDILMSWSGSLGVYVWVRPEAIVNQHIFKVVPAAYPAWLVFTCLGEAMPFFRQTAADKATTMGHIKRHHLDDAVVGVPPADVLAGLDVSLDPLWQRMVVAEVEALELADLRDALLPELLSGRLRVRDAEQAVSEAV